MSWAELQRRVGALAATLRAQGVGRGDRVVAFMPNIPESVIAFLAVASLGAIWSVCSPDMGRVAVLDRFRQIEPKAMIAVDGYHYGGKAHDRRALVGELLAELPSVEHLVLLPQLDPAAGVTGFANATTWADATAGNAPLQVEHVPFEHPLWVVYSSGTTGLPKPIVHSQGGVVIEHVKAIAFHLDLGPGDRYHWYSTTGWMMWNFQVGGLLAGCTICLFDGNPGYPDLNALWRFVADQRVDFFGAGAAFYASCQKAGIEPTDAGDLSRAARPRLDRFAAVAGKLPVAARQCPQATCGSTRSPAAPIWSAPSSAACRLCRCISAKCSAAASGRKSKPSTRPASR